MNATNRERSVVRKSGEETLYKGGLDFIISIDKANKLASYEFETEIPGARLATVFLMDDGDARIFQGVIFGDVAGIIGRTIVD